MEPYDWIVAQRPVDFSVSTAGIISKALFLNSSFKKNEDTTLCSCVYRLLARWKLSCCMKRHVGQKLNGRLIKVETQFVANIKEKF